MASIEEAREILKSLGMPPAQHNQMSGLTLIALCRLTPDAPGRDHELERLADVLTIFTLSSPCLQFCYNCL